MNDQSTSFPELNGSIRTLQIIVVALATGVIVFGAVAIVIAIRGAPAQSMLISLVMAALAAAGVLSRIVVPLIYVRQARCNIASGRWPVSKNRGYHVPDTDAGKLAAVFMSKTIISAAILEGAAFANLLAFLLEGQWFSLLIAGAMLIGILMSFPLGFAANGWVEDQLRRVEEERSFRRTEG